MIRRAPSAARATWTVVPNLTIEDERLSWEALGLLTYLLSKPDHWQVSVSHLMKQRSAGRDKIRRLIAELSGAGYIYREARRSEGKFAGDDLVVYDMPTEPGSTGDGLAGAGESPTSNDSLEVKTDTKNDSLVVASTTTPEVDELCALLAAKVATFSGLPEKRVTERWRKDMRLLFERGPSGRATPEVIEPDRVRKALTVIFDMLADPGTTGFCWAAQVRSPGALRKHWDAIALAAKTEMRSRVAADPLGAISAGYEPQRALES